MEFQYAYDINDWIAFQEYYRLNSKGYRRNWFISLLFIPFISCISLFILYIYNKLHVAHIIIDCIIVVAWVFYVSYLYQRPPAKRYRKLMEKKENATAFGIHRIVLDDDGVQIFEPEGSQSVKWIGIKKLGETEDHYFLFNSTFSAFVIPKKKISAGILDLDAMLKSHNLPGN